METIQNTIPSFSFSKKIFGTTALRMGIKWGRRRGSSRAQQTKTNPKGRLQPLQLRFMHNKTASFKKAPTFSNWQKRWRLCKCPREILLAQGLSVLNLGPTLILGNVFLFFLIKGLYFHQYPCVPGPVLVPGHKNLGISTGALWMLTQAHNKSTAKVPSVLGLAGLAFIQGFYLMATWDAKWRKLVLGLSKTKVTG